MPIRKLSTPAPAATPAKKSSTPIIEVDDTIVSQFVQADAAAKEAKAILDEVKPLITEIATERYFQLRATGVASSSIKLKDPNGAVARFDFKNQYKAAEADAVEALFEGELGRDANDFVQESLKVTFDNGVFYDANGNFVEDRFQKFQSACAQVAAALGVVNPLKSSTQVTAKPSFHDARFGAFSVAENIAISKVLGNTTALVAVSQPVSLEAASVTDGEEV